MPITILQERFSREFVRDGDATNAYRRAKNGAAGSAAKSVGHELLHLPQVQARIAELARDAGFDPRLFRRRLPDAPRRERARVDLYFVLCEPLAAIKIGVTGCISARLQHLQSASPVELQLVGLLAGGGKYESALHSAFAHVRLRGEWFEAVPHLREIAGQPHRVPRFLKTQRPNR